jgi:hypothetical protein
MFSGHVSILTHTENPHVRRIETAISLINGYQRFFHLTFQRVEQFPKTHKVMSPSQLSESLAKDWTDQYTILIVEDQLDDNWFSHEYRSSAIISIYDWESRFAPPSLRTYLIYQITQALAHFAADLSEEMALNMVHEPPVGCIYDMTVHKPDIKLGMVAGNLCQRCSGQLRGLGTDEGAIEAVAKILSLVRAEALGRPVVFDPTEVFVVMRFTRNDENDNAWKFGIKIGVEACGLRATRGDDIVESMQILEKVNKAIQRSRLIVAKVDENNLNVYYELGYSMGIGKDVLLVSSNELAINIPSDLKSWECLTYEKGNYTQLSDKISRYLADHYHVVSARSNR